METTKKDTSLIGCMMDVPNPRALYNQRHKFIAIITIAIMAVICGMDTWNEIEDWARSKKEWLGTFLELPGEIPSHDTINRVFQMLDPEQFHRAFFPWTSTIVGKVQGVVAIDGKTVRRSREEASGLRPIHVVSAWDCPICKTQPPPLTKNNPVDDFLLGGGSTSPRWQFYVHK